MPFSPPYLQLYVSTSMFFPPLPQPHPWHYNKCTCMRSAHIHTHTGTHAHTHTRARTMSSTISPFKCQLHPWCEGPSTGPLGESQKHWDCTPALHLERITKSRWLRVPLEWCCFQSYLMTNLRKSISKCWRFHFSRFCTKPEGSIFLKKQLHNILHCNYLTE